MKDDLSKINDDQIFQSYKKGATNNLWEVVKEEQLKLPNKDKKLMFAAEGNGHSQSPIGKQNRNEDVANDVSELMKFLKKLFGGSLERVALIMLTD